MGGFYLFIYFICLFVYFKKEKQCYIFHYKILDLKCVHFIVYIRIFMTVRINLKLTSKMCKIYM